ncbi:MAG: dinitrogenase iron-molybdenum cofactor biosynthesis protein [Bacteroidetes bacterium]|nr:MAG: dinitrogenase iron-molybdenum cofactor biosynthesis protein [Bacteroidota bacterium]
MKIFIPSSGDSIESPIDSRFGRCQYFIIYDIVLDNYEIYRNPFAGMENASGSSLALTIKNKGIEYVIASHIGKKTFNILSENEIKIYKAESGSTVKEAITNYLEGNLYQVFQYAQSDSFFQPHNLN